MSAPFTGVSPVAPVRHPIARSPVREAIERWLIARLGITIDGTTVPEATGNITIDGDDVTEVTVDGTTVWTADAIPDSAIAQYDAQAVSGSDGTTISTWGDEIGSFDLTGGSPTIRDSGINGNRALQFDGSDDELSNGSFSLTAPLTVIAVLELVGTGDQIFLDSTTDDNYLRWNSSNWSYKAFGAGEIGGSTDTTVQLLTGITNGSTDGVLRENGTQTGSDTGTPEDFGDLLVGRFSGGGLFADAYLGELVFYDADLSSTGDLSGEEQRLADKWGITI